MLKLQQAAFIVFKGDANYRRVGLDHIWEPDVPFALMKHVFGAPTSFLCLRTLKSDGIVGLTASQTKALDAQDKNWRHNGQRGVIQACFQSNA